MPRQWTNYQSQKITLALIKTVAKAAPPGKPREIHDSGSGLILRHQPSGYLSLYVRLARGKRERLCDARRVIDPSTKLTLGQVKNEAKRLRGEHAGGRDFKDERERRRAIPTLTTFLDDIFEPWALQNRRAGQGTVDRVRVCFEKRYGNLKLDQITPARLESWRAQRQRKGVSAGTINRDIAALRGALTRAVKLEIIPRNPLLGVERAEVDPHKRSIRALTEAEKEKLIEALVARDDKKREERVNANEWRKERGYELLPVIGRFADTLTPSVIVSLETGLRRGELFSLQWPSIDLDEKILRVEGETAKTFETRELPLNKLAHKTLRDWWLQCGQSEEGFVFALNGERLGNLKKGYYSILKAAGIKRVNARGERVVWHSMRHTFGSLLGAANVDPTTLMKLMGHANLTTTQRYLHTEKERKREAVERLLA